MNTLRTRDVKSVPPKIAEPRPLSRQQIRLKQQKGQQRFLQARKAEDAYRRNLKALAKQVGVIVKGFAPQGIVGAHAAALTAALEQYSTLIQPWARAVASRMLADVDRRDSSAWQAHGNEMGLALRREIESAPTGETMRKLLDFQVDLIQSIPREAAQRVHEIVTGNLYSGVRAETVAQEILRSGDIAVHRAETIARTETSRAASTLTQARAMHIGAESYIWRAIKDGNTRHLHKELNGKVFKWTEPPVAGENGERAHPGCIYNCRCYPEPIIPDEL